jgi:hypothetical protein
VSGGVAASDSLPLNFFSAFWNDIPSQAFCVRPRRKKPLRGLQREASSELGSVLVVAAHNRSISRNLLIQRHFSSTGGDSRGPAANLANGNKTCCGSSTHLQKIASIL